MDGVIELLLPAATYEVGTPTGVEPLPCDIRAQAHPTHIHALQHVPVEQPQVLQGSARGLL